MYHPYPSKIDKSLFSPNNINRKAYYGLPNQVKFCKRCTNSNQIPQSTPEFRNNNKVPKQTVNFDDNCICDACHAKTEKERINWEDRELELIELCNKYRKNNGEYDCLVPGSGGKDSFMQAHLLKYKYNMNPLTCTWAPHIYTDWGWKNHQAWIHAGFDNILYSPNGKVHRLLTRLAMENLFHPFQPFIIGQKNLAPKIAAQNNIQLIFYGENEAEYHNTKSDNESPKRDEKFFTAKAEDQIYLGGENLTQLREYGLEKVDWKPYLPIEANLIEKNNIEVHYLGYYIKWHPQGAYYYAIENGEFKSSPERTVGTYSTYNSIDDKIDDFHYHTTWIKFGIGRATYDSAQEVRSGDITREEGVALIKKYDGEFPKRFSNEIFEYLSLPEKLFPNIKEFFEQPIFDLKYYNALSDKYRSQHLWNYTENDGWQLRFTIFNEENLVDQESTAINWEGIK